MVQGHRVPNLDEYIYVHLHSACDRAYILLPRGEVIRVPGQAGEDSAQNGREAVLFRVRSGESLLRPTADCLDRFHLRRRHSTHDGRGVSLSLHQTVLLPLPLRSVFQGAPTLQLGAQRSRYNNSQSDARATVLDQPVHVRSR